jgi:hypothetical protein
MLLLSVRAERFFAVFLLRLSLVVFFMVISFYALTIQDELLLCTLDANSSLISESSHPSM